MRYRDFVTELNMAPGNLRKFAGTSAVSQMRAGFEAELLLPGEYNGDTEPDPDYDQDTTLPRGLDMGDIKDFFELGRNDDRSLRKLQVQYDSWVSDESTGWIENNIQERTDYLKDQDEDLDDDEAREKAWNELTSEYYQDLEYNNAGLLEFCRSNGMHTYYDVYKEYDYDLTWPHMKNVNGFGSAVKDQGYVLSLTKLVGAEIEVNDDYHGTRKNASSWYIEPDSSIETPKEGYMGVEIVSPPMAISNMLFNLRNVLNWAKDVGGFTNNTTGFHVGVSVAGTSTQNVDYLKLILFLGDQYVLQQFGRTANNYTKSSVIMAQQIAANQDPHDIAITLANMRRGLIIDAGRNVLASNNGNKYVSVNMKQNYIEFRSMGNNYLEQVDNIVNTVLRYIRAYAVACDPNAERQEYAKKLSKLLNPTNADQIAPFVQFAMGGLNKDSLITVLKARAMKPMPPITPGNAFDFL